jgi:hypothetical protein
LDKPDRTDPAANPDGYKLGHEYLLRNVRHGRHWKRLADHLGWRVLALLPTGGEGTRHFKLYHSTAENRRLQLIYQNTRLREGSLAEEHQCRNSYASGRAYEGATRSRLTSAVVIGDES